MSDNEQKHEKRESVADIVAQIRAAAYIQNADTPESVLRIAARIEAAWNREKAEIEAEALAVGGMVETLRRRGPTTEKSSAVGNAAAMREALEAILKEANTQYWNDNGIDITWLMEKAKAALAAPARNCDLYASATEALKAQDVAFNEDNFKNGECKLGCPGCDDGLINCEILWLFATAKERKGEGDGR